MFDTPCVSTPRTSAIVSTSAPSAASSRVSPSFSKICATVRRSAASGIRTWSFSGTLKRSRIIGASSQKLRHDLLGEPAHRPLDFRARQRVALIEPADDLRERELLARGLHPVDDLRGIAEDGVVAAER